MYSVKDEKTYTGSTNDLDKRIKEHNKGKVEATKNRRPLKLIYCENIDSLEKARARERYYKTGAGRRKLKEIFKKLNLSRDGEIGIHVSLRN